MPRLTRPDLTGLRRRMGKKLKELSERRTGRARRYVALPRSRKPQRPAPHHRTPYCDRKGKSTKKITAA